MVQKLVSARTASAKVAMVASVFGILVSEALADDLPDLVVSDIVLAPPPQGYENQEVIFIAATIRNLGADCDKEISIACDFACRGDSRRYIGGMKLAFLARGSEAVVGDRSPVELSDCFFSSRLKFTCTVDHNRKVAETEEGNNSLTKSLLISQPGA